MLVRPERKFPGTLFMLRGTALWDIFPYWAVIVALSVVVTYEFEPWHLSDYSLTTVPFSLIGLALSIFLGFRNSACYDRWWEGRKLWGALVNTSRTWARQVQTFLVEEGGDTDELVAFRRRLIQRQNAYNYALKAHLRTQASFDVLTEFLDPDEVAELLKVANVPAAIARRTGGLLREAYRRGWVHALHLPVLEQSLTRLLDIQGGCERIKKTPVPLPYTIFTHRIVGIYVVALPFGICKDVGILTPLVVGLVSFAFLGLDDIGTQLEDPFEEDDNDLPLSALCRTIEIDLLQAMGDTEVPEAITPKDGVLL